VKSGLRWPDQLFVIRSINAHSSSLHEKRTTRKMESGNQASRVVRSVENSEFLEELTLSKYENRSYIVI